MVALAYQKSLLRSLSVRREASTRIFFFLDYVRPMTTCLPTSADAPGGGRWGGGGFGLLFSLATAI